MNILIVDDNPTNLKLLRVQLEAEGHTICEAADGIEALALLEQHPVDAVISDILMPRMDGYRLCHEIRKSNRLHDLPFMIYTATYTSPSDEKLAFEVGADKYLKKPSSTETLLAALREVTTLPRATAHTAALKEVELLKEYSERLVAKLEERNITLERTNTELHTTRGQLQQMLEHSPAVTYSLKVEGERATLQVVSANITRLFGFSAEECTNGWWEAHLHPEDRERVIAGILETIKYGFLNAEYRMQHKDGRYVWVEDNRRLVRDTEDRPTGIVGVWTDITERRQAKSQMLRAQRLESIGTLAGGVAHDLNNALAPIMLGSELLRLEYPDTAIEHLDVIQASAKRGADMVKQLLTFAKGTEGERLPVQPLDLLEEMVKLVKSTFPKNIRLETKCPKNLQPILGDATQLHQVLLNLCVNARDAMPKGGTLTLAAEITKIDTKTANSLEGSKPGTYICWSVTDTGTGIPQEVLDHIFEPFFSTKSSSKGTGLGLSTVMGIVKSHGGFLHVNSVPEQGSTFTVYLPIAETESGEAFVPPLAEIAFQGNGETILVVDDEASIRSVIRATLATLNFKVLTASDGADALLQAAERHAELRAVITDFQMPHMDGLAFVRVLKARLPNASIIVTSGEMEQHAASEFLKLGVIAQLEKPFDKEKLITALKQIFQP